MNAAQPGRPHALDFDPHDPAIAIDPFPTYAALREWYQVSWSRSWGGFWVASRYASVAAASRMRTLHAGHTLPNGVVQGISVPPVGRSGPLIPLELNPPQSLAYRRLLTDLYSPASVKARIPEIRRLAADSLDAVIERGSCDIVQALTERVPSILTMRDIGIAEERWAEVDSLVHDALMRDPASGKGADAGQAVCVIILEEMEELRDCGSGGLMSRLLSATIDGEPVSDEAIVSIVYLLLLGIHPTSALVATALWYLARHPELRDRLVADRSSLHSCADEFLRWVSPVQGTCRTAVADLRLGDTKIAAGERVFLSWASANRDATVFEDADSVAVGRNCSHHIAFGSGPHYCLGASLVRTVFVVVINEVLCRIPDFEIADEPTISWFPDLSSVYGIDALSLKFTPGRRTLVDEVPSVP